MFATLLVCGLVNASVIHLGYLVTTIVFMMYKTLTSQAWLVFSVVAYVVVLLSLGYHVAYPPLFEGCTDTRALKLASEDGCSEPLNSQEVDLFGQELVVTWLDDKLSEVCPVLCDEDTANRATTFKYEDAWNILGIHPCHEALDCRFESYGWSTIVIFVTSMQLSFRHFQEKHQRRISSRGSSRRLMDVVEMDLASDSIKRNHIVRLMFRSVIYVVGLWFFLMVHLADSPKASYAMLGFLYLTFLLLFLKYSESTKWATCLTIFWTALAGFFYFWMVLEYVCTLDWAGQVFESFSKNWFRLESSYIIFPCDLSLDSNLSTSMCNSTVHFEGYLTESEVGLHSASDRRTSDYVNFFSLVALAQVAFLGRKRFTMPALLVTPRGIESFDRIGSGWTKRLAKFAGEQATLHSPTILLFAVYHANQVQPTAAMYAWYLVPTSALLLFSSAHKHLWMPTGIYAACCWVSLYLYQFRYTNYVSDHWMFGIWGYEHFNMTKFFVLPDDPIVYNQHSARDQFDGENCGKSMRAMNITNSASNFVKIGDAGEYDCYNYDPSVKYDLWDSKLTCHLVVVAAVAFYRINCTPKLYRTVNDKPLFAGAWPHLTPSEIEIYVKSAGKGGRRKFIVSNFTHAFGQIIFFAAILVSIYSTRNNSTVIWSVIMGAYFLSSRRLVLNGMHLCFFLLVAVEAFRFLISFMKTWAPNVDVLQSSPWLMSMADAVLRYSRDQCTTMHRDGVAWYSCDIGPTMFFTFFAMSIIIHNERRTRRMVCHLDKRAQEEEKGFVGPDGLKKLQAAIVRQLFIKDMSIHAFFQEVDATDNDGLLGITDSLTFVRTMHLVLRSTRLANQVGDQILLDLAEQWRFDVSRVINKDSKDSFKLKQLVGGKFHVCWQSFCDEVGTDIQGRVTRLPDSSGHPMNLQPGKQHSLGGVLWSLFLALAVDSMAIVIALSFINVEKRSLISFGYVIFGVMFMHAQRSETDVALLKSLHRYTYFHLLLQSLYMVFDPLCLTDDDMDYVAANVGSDVADVVTRLNCIKRSLCVSGSYPVNATTAGDCSTTYAPKELGRIITELFGLETITSGYPTFQNACLLFAWMILVTELQKSRAYERMRLHVTRDRKLARSRIWLSFAKRLRERKDAILKIENSLCRLNNTAKRLRRRRGSVSRWHTLRQYTNTHAATMQLQSEQKKYIQLRVNVMGAKNLHRDCEAFVKMSLHDNGYDSARDSSAVVFQTEHASVSVDDLGVR